MAKKGSSASKKVHIAASITLREESSGKKQKPVSAKSMLKFDHIRNLAIWAGSEASIPSLGAFCGRRLAATAEALDVPPDPSLFSCQRCESVLQPGSNCTVRIEKNKAKVQNRRKKANLAMRNSVVYKCHACSHRNLKRGTPRRYMKELCLPKVKPVTRSDPMRLTVQKISEPVVVAEGKDGTAKMDALPQVAEDRPMVHAPATPVTTIGTALLDSKSRKRTRSRAKRAAEPGSSSALTDAENTSGALNKRKRKTWTSLKEIAERDEQENRRNFTSLAIPFVM